MANIPGSIAAHAIITDVCRINRGDDGAWSEAVARVKEQYDAIMIGWVNVGTQPTVHLVITLERPPSDES